MLPDRVSNPGPLTYESDPLPIAKFQMLISEICQYFLLKKCEKLWCKTSLIISTKYFSVFGYKVVKHLTS